MREGEGGREKKDFKLLKSFLKVLIFHDFIINEQRIKKKKRKCMRTPLIMSLIKEAKSFLRISTPLSLHPLIKIYVVELLKNEMEGSNGRF